MQIEAKDKRRKRDEKIRRVIRPVDNPYIPAPSSPDSSKKRPRAEEDEDALAHKSSASDEVYEEKKIKKINRLGNPSKKPKTDHFIPETPNVQNKTDLAPYPSLSSPDSPSKQKSDKRRRSEEDDRAVARKLSLDDEDEDEEGSETASPENKLLIEHLKQLSEMKPSLKKTDSLVYELFISPSADSKFSDAWKEAGRGIKQLKEGLRKINEVQKLLCPTHADDDSTREHQE